MPTYATGTDWYAQGMILHPGPQGSLIEIKRIERPVFSSKEAAEEYAIQLCKQWIDANLDGPKVRR